MELHREMFSPIFVDHYRRDHVTLEKREHGRLAIDTKQLEMLAGFQPVLHHEAHSKLGHKYKTCLIVGTSAPKPRLDYSRDLCKMQKVVHADSQNPRMLQPPAQPQCHRGNTFSAGQPLDRKSTHLNHASTVEVDVEQIVRAHEFCPNLVRGVATGNPTIVHQKSWLEVCDPKHRYGSNLRAYYKKWMDIGAPGDQFWKWLNESTDEVEDIPREVLEKETVLYCETKAERERFAIQISDGGVFISKTTKQPISTGEKGWIFVLQDGILYGSKKEVNSTPRIHHTTFVAGGGVQAAGMLVVDNGKLEKVYPHSGHYRPSEQQVRRFLIFLQQSGVNLKEVLVDVQRIQRMRRGVTAQGEKNSKKETAYFWTAEQSIAFLNLKSTAWRSCLFCHLVKAAEARVERVKMVLDLMSTAA